MAIDYVAYDQSGGRVAGVLEVDTEEEAEEQLWASGLFVLELRRQQPEGPPSLRTRLIRRLFKPRFADVITFTRQLETLLRAGVQLPNALKQLQSGTRNISMRSALAMVLRDIEEGERFSSAISRHPRIFPPYYLRMVPMAEATGELPRVLQELTRNMDRRMRVARQAQSAVLAPAIAMAVGSLAALVLFTFVLPRIVELLGEFGTELPRVMRVLLTVGEFGQAWGTWTLVGLLVLLVLILFYFGRTNRGRRHWHRMLLAAPVIGPVVRSSTMFDVSSMLALLLRAGVAPAVALRTIVDVIGNVVIREAFLRVDLAVTGGGRLGAALQRQQVIPPPLL